MANISILAIFLFLAVVTSASVWGEEGKVSVSLGPYQLSVPEKYLPQRSLIERFSSVIGLDRADKEMLLQIGEQEIEENVSGYTGGRYSDGIMARLVALKPEEKALYLTPARLADIWHGQRDYEDAIIEKYETMDLFRVYRRIEYPYSWTVVLAKPSVGAPPTKVDEYVVASCIRAGEQVAAAKATPRCRTRVIWSMLMMEFSISEENFEVLDGVKSYLAEKMAEWVVGCRGESGSGESGSE